MTKELVCTDNICCICCCYCEGQPLVGRQKLLNATTLPDRQGLRICSNSRHLICVGCLRKCVYETHKVVDCHGRIRCFGNGAISNHIEASLEPCTGFWPRILLLKLAPSDQERTRLLELLKRYEVPHPSFPCFRCKAIHRAPSRISPDTCTVLRCNACNINACIRCGKEYSGEVHRCLICEHLFETHDDQVNPYFRRIIKDRPRNKRTRSQMDDGKNDMGLLRNQQIMPREAWRHLKMIIGESDDSMLHHSCPKCLWPIDKDGVECNTLTCGRGCGFQICATCGRAAHVENDGLDNNHWFQLDQISGHPIYTGQCPQYDWGFNMLIPEALTKTERDREILRFRRRRSILAFLGSLSPRLIDGMLRIMRNEKMSPYMESMIPYEKIGRMALQAPPNKK